MNRKDIAIASGIFVVTLFLAYRYTDAVFKITSDSYIEYSTYLVYVQIGSQWWRPLTDNMLSTCLWTTYFPALIQKWVLLGNPDIVYKLWLTVIVSATPAVLYIVARKYTTWYIAGIMALVLISSQYYSGFIMYARILVALTFGLLLVLSINSHSKYKWHYIVLTSGCLLTAHYSTALFYVAIMIFAAVIYYAVKRKANRTIGITAGIISFMAFVYYGIIASSSRVLNYASISVNRIAKSLFGWNTPMYPASILPVPATNTIPSNVPSSGTQPYTPPTQTIPFAGERFDFIVGKATILCRFLLASYIIYSLVRRGEWKKPFIYIYGAGVLCATLAIFIPQVSITLGSMRMSFLSLPLELIGIALWHSYNNKQPRTLNLALTLGMAVFIYH